MRAEGWGLVLVWLGWSALASGAEPTARQRFLEHPELAGAHAAWAELDAANRVDDLMAPFMAASELYPLDELTIEACEREDAAIRAALQRNPLASPALLALAMCAEARADHATAAHWRAALEAWLGWVLEDGRGHRPERPAAVASVHDYEAFALAANVDWDATRWLWGGESGQALVVEVEWHDAEGRYRPLYFDLSQRYLDLHGVHLSAAQTRTQVRELLRQYARNYPAARALELEAEPWLDTAQREELRNIAAQEPQVAIRWLQHCAMAQPMSCIPADLDPVLNAAEQGSTHALLALLWHQAYVETPTTQDAAHVLWQAVVRRMGPDLALTQVWDAAMARRDAPAILPAPVATQLRAQATRKDPLSLYRLALAPANADDHSLAERRLEQAAQAGLMQAQLQWARRQMFADPSTRQGLAQSGLAREQQARVAAALDGAVAQGLAQARPYRDVWAVQRAAPAAQDQVQARLLQDMAVLPGDLALWVARLAIRRGRLGEAMEPVWQALDQGEPGVRIAALDVLHELIERGQKLPGGRRIEAVLIGLSVPHDDLERYCTAGHWPATCLRRFMVEAGTDPQAHQGPASRWLQRAVELGSPIAVSELGGRLAHFGDTTQEVLRGVALLDRAMGMGVPTAMNNAAWYRCVSPGLDARQRALGLRLAEGIAQPDLASRDTLAACQAANGDFTAAAATQQQVLDEYLQRDPAAAQNAATLARFRDRLAAYQRAQVWLEHRGVAVSAQP